MWRQRDDGTPMLPEGVLDSVPLRPLWGNVVVDCTKKNQEKEVVRAGEWYHNTKQWWTPMCTVWTY